VAASDRIYFIFQPAEENEGGARLMIDEAVPNGMQRITSRNLHPLEGADV
jgi:metal-dependent amidase/aminoacylase/carboxypeptidase family protein